MARKTVRPAYVRIQSNVTIKVFPSLINQDVTNADAHVPDRLKVNPLWPKLGVDIHQGMGWYPSEIVDWNSVKALQNDKILTIGEFSDTCDDADAIKVKAQLTKETNTIAAKLGAKSLNDLVADDKEETDE